MAVSRVAENADRVTGTLTNLGLIVVFVTIGGFFSGSELAVLTLRESQVERLPGRRGERVRRLRRRPQPVPGLGAGRRDVRWVLRLGLRRRDAVGAAGCGARRNGGCRERLGVGGVRRGHGVRVLPLARAGRARAEAHRAAARGRHRAERVAGARRRGADQPPAWCGCCRGRRTCSCGCSGSTRTRERRRSPRRSCAISSAPTATWTSRSGGCSATCSARPTASSRA